MNTQDNGSKNTHVIELHSPEPVGTDARGREKVRLYLAELAKLLGMAPAGPPLTHVSPKYGLAGWIPLESASAVHLYAWDDRTPSFISVDICLRRAVRLGEVLDHVKAFFAVKREADMVHKSVSVRHEDAGNWRELDPTIHRQRLSVQARLLKPLTARDVQALLINLCARLRMKGLSDPCVHGNTAWMHWETSGVVAHWNLEALEIDIYTCKPFSSEDARRFVGGHPQIRITAFKDF